MVRTTALKRSRVAVAPCSTANLGPGFDVFGLALDALYDSVRITVSKNIQTRSAHITIKVTNDSGIPTAVDSNSAGLVVRRMTRDFGIDDPLEVEIKKGIPAGYGFGSSAASAAAAAIAFKSLYDLSIGSNALIEYAAEGEVASAGAKHYDNVSASVLGGFVISSTTRNGGLRFIRLDPPKDLVLVMAVPLSIRVPERKTEVARSALPKEVPLRDVVHNISSASTVVAGFAKKDVDMIASGIDDIIVEPARKNLVPGYQTVKQNAMGAGALAVTISGAGPSMVALLKTSKNSKKVAGAMLTGFKTAGVQGRTFICRPSRGARVV
jgi:homoserine kinase